MNDYPRIVLDENGKSRWVASNGIIEIPLVSGGLTGEDLIRQGELQGVRIDDLAKSILRSEYFIPAVAGTKYEVRIPLLKFFGDNDYTRISIATEAFCEDWSEPHPEVACLLRNVIKEEDLKVFGFDYVVVMHDSVGPVLLENGDPNLVRLAVCCKSGICGDVQHHLLSDLPLNYGFAFVIKSF